MRGKTGRAFAPASKRLPSCAGRGCPTEPPSVNAEGRWLRGANAPTLPGSHRLRSCAFGPLRRRFSVRCRHSEVGRPPDYHCPVESMRLWAIASLRNRRVPIPRVSLSAWQFLQGIFCPRVCRALLELTQPAPPRVAHWFRRRRPMARCICGPSFGNWRPIPR